MEIGRTDIDKAFGIFERIAVAQEDLIKLATEERIPAPSPAYCPHCGMFNPKIRSGGGDVEDNMHAFVLVGKCVACEGDIFGLPEGWQIYGDQREVEAALANRGADDGNS